MASRVWNWLFGSSDERILVQLVPTAAAKTLPGFSHGGLTLVATRGETVGAVMERFNTYRGPDAQISTLYTQDGELIPFTTVLTGPVHCIVRNSSKE